MATVNGADYNPTSDTVSFAFITTGEPGSGDWHGGTWAAATTSGACVAQILIGPANSGIPLGPGTYEVWVKVTDSPEVPVIEADTLQIV